MNPTETTNEVGDKTNAQSSSRTLLFYEHPIPLNRDLHGDLRLKRSPAGMFPFAGRTNSIPIAGEEFFAACHHYPIVFAGDDASTSVPSILLGLHDDQNLFVDDDGNWSTGYVPAFVRRYPFVLGEQPGSDDFTVYVDEAYAGFGRDDGEPLFEADGNEGDFLRQAKQFLGRYQGQMQRTRDFVMRLHDLNLLQDRVIRGTRQNGEEYVLRGFQVLEESRLQALTDGQLRQLLAGGQLAWIYAHLISLVNVQELAHRLDRTAAPDTAEKQSPSKEVAEEGPK